MMSCACGEVLGKKRADDGKPGAGTARFSKWAISILKDDDMEGDGERVEWVLSISIKGSLLTTIDQSASLFRCLSSRICLSWLKHMRRIDSPLPTRNLATGVYS